MMRSLIIFCAIVFLVPEVFSQDRAGKSIHLNGVIVDAENKLPLSYANIGILNKSFGTVSDTTGNFSLSVNAENSMDTLQISLVGYQTVKLVVRDFAEKLNGKPIELQVRAYVLDAVEISIKKEVPEIAGRNKAGGFIQFAMHPKKEIVLGTEIGMRFKAATYPAFLKDFSWFFSVNNFKKIKFRINIYSLKNNMPDTLLLNKDVFVDVVDYKSGWNKVDLTPYNVIVSTDFVISIQWLEHDIKDGEQAKVFIPGAMSSKHASYFRIASQDKWTRTKTNLCYYVTLLH
jgi:hypothetical protein